MSSVIQLTWPELAMVKDALITVEKIMNDCNTAELELKKGLTVCMDGIGISIKASLKYYEDDNPNKPLKGGDDEHEGISD